MERYIDSIFEDAKELIRSLCSIPAPSGHEEKRAEFVKDWFECNGGKDVQIDEMKNVICSYNVSNNVPLIVMMAHTDTVFPDTEPMPFEEHDGKMFSPGVLDDTANLVSLMFAAKYIMENNISLKYGFLFVANSCEEGLGNSRGCRKIIENYGSGIKNFITVDGTSFSKIVNKAVGSHRYEVTVKTEGGHSFKMFGKPNAIERIAAIIEDLYKVEVPKIENSITTYNVGIIKGGTSVNTIAQEASMLYEYRSDNVECLSKMNAIFNNIIERYRNTGLEVLVEKIGDRPCSILDNSDFDFNYLVQSAVETIKINTGKEPVMNSGSTDANIPLSIGIPAICIAGAEGSGVHTREEFLIVDSIKTGIKIILDLVLNNYSTEKN